jgi:hypothetical protein
MNVVMLSAIVIPIFGAAMIIIKVSAALSLRRVKRSTPWKVGLYAIIGLMGSWEIESFIGVSQLCRPISDWWDIINTTPHCVDPNVMGILSMTGFCHRNRDRHAAGSQSNHLVDAALSVDGHGSVCQCRIHCEALAHSPMATQS